MRTMEEVLGLPPMNLNDALAAPMSDIFNTTPSRMDLYRHARRDSLLHATATAAPAQPCNNPTPDAKYWARVTKGMDFHDADRVDGGPSTAFSGRE